MSTMALQLPSSFVDVEREEMEYVDGGYVNIIADWLAGAMLNVAFGGVADGIAGSIAGFIKKEGVQQAEKIFTATVETRLAGWGLQRFSRLVGPAVGLAMCALDMGGTIARFIDAHDACPNNGWITI